MKILLVHPSNLNRDGVPVKYSKAVMPPLTLAILASLTPERHDVELVEEMVDYIDYSKEYDLVGITSLTANAPRGYQIADKFRAKGTKVIIGGIHASALPYEALEHADSVVVGEVEEIWEHILDDFERNDYKEIYQGNFSDMNKLVLPRWDKLNLKSFAISPGQKYPMLPIYTTRGCLNNCRYCAVTKFYGKTFRMRPIDHVLQEIDALKAGIFYFVDDNICCNEEYAKELFKQLAKRDLRWYSQVSSTILKKPHLVEAAAKAGCGGFSVGIESINKESLKSVKKGFNNPDKYKELFDLFKKNSIFPIMNTIFGFDADTKETIQDTINYILDMKVWAMLFLLTPLPGTELYKEMEDAGRLLTRDWSKYNAGNVIIKPTNFEVEELNDLFWGAYKQLYSWKNIFRVSREVTKNANNPMLEFVAFMYYLGYIQRNNALSRNPQLADGVKMVKYKPEQ